MARTRSNSILDVGPLLPIAFVVLGLAMPALAQQTQGAVTRTVVDPLGARVSGATVRLLQEGQPVKEAKSDGQGAFTFDGLAEGRYQIDAVAAGFQLRITAPVFVASGARVELEVSLPLGPLETQVTVTATANEVLPSQVGAPVTVIDATTLGVLGNPK